ncbi:MAG: carbohydrate kinase [Roseibacillus sp.]|nr:carbohydrate kinase [Roseibacillus sp.]HAO95223.1 carbohydrate kinase [Verrucomicrobiales bacterium]|tara:strand:- start:107 stop:1042 length:936 start_codon:yes stop_codon:yes gene_type:complete
MSHPLPLLVGGSIAIDNVKTPSDEATNLLGGSASYASLAATYFTKPVHLVGVIGNDYPPEHLAMLERHGVTLGGVERSEGASFSWSGEYHQNMNDRTTHNVAVNVLESWEVNLPVAVAASPVVVLANMAPKNQLEMLDQCVGEDRFVLADTMDLWIGIAREELEKVLGRIDLLVINETEAREYAGTSNLVEAGALLRRKGPGYVIIKLGEFGAILFGPPEINHGIFRCGAFPLREVADPTGAGDTFLGAMAGYLASLGNTDYQFEDIRNAIVRGTVMASFTCEAFSTRRIEDLSSLEIEERLQTFTDISCW